MISAIILSVIASMISFCNDSKDKSPIINPPDTLPHITVIDWGATWCAANDMIAYMHGESYVYPNIDSSGLYVINSSGEGKRALLYEHYLEGIDWSPDGRWLVVYLRNTLVKMSFPDGIIDTLMPSGQFWEPAWSPDGSKILSVIVAGNQRGVYAIESDGSNYRPIIPYGDYPSWIYSDSLVYLNYSLDFPAGSMCLADSSGSFRRLLLEGGPIGTLYFENIKANLPTRRVVCDPSIPSDTSNLSVWKYDTATNTFSRFINHALFPNFSPDGQSVVYTDIRTGYGNLIIINWDSSGARQLTEPINGGEP